VAFCDARTFNLEVQGDRDGEEGMRVCLSLLTILIDDQTQARTPRHQPLSECTGICLESA